jgi:hypothetical protein
MFKYDSETTHIIRKTDSLIYDDQFAGIRQ